MSVSQALELAVQHHQAGRLGEAEAIYRQILSVEPQNAHALHLLGVVAHQAGRSEVAVELLKQARALIPNDPGVQTNLGAAYRKMGQLDEAIAAYRRALELQPDLAAAHHNLGIALQERGRLDEAIASYRRALELRPDHAAACSNLGNALREAGRLDEAIESYRRALELQPNNAAVHDNLGTVLLDRGQPADAMASFHRALQLQPDFPEAHNNLGNALKAQGHIDEAIAAYRRALQLQPDYAAAHNNIGIALSHRGRLDEAIASYRRALVLQPDFPEAHNNLGNTLKDQGHVDEAIASFRRALELQPDLATAHYNLGNALADGGQLEEAIAAYRQALQLRPDFTGAHYNLGNALAGKDQFHEAIACYHRALALQPGFAEAHNNLGNALSNQGRLDEAIAAYRTALRQGPDLARIHSNLLLNLHYSPGPDAEAIFREHGRWEELHAQALADRLEPHANEPSPDRRLRIGYVSPDFWLHPVAFFLENLLASHDRGQVEVFCYAHVWRADPVTARLREQAGHWRDITGLTDAQAAELIRRDQIDILVDLAGHTADNRLLIFARKPAPVQVSYLGYCDTTGMKAMDYRLTDAHADPPGTSERFHREQLVRLPETFACFRPAEEAPVGPLPALARGQVTFASFHTLAKLNNRLLESWARILGQVPGSRLMMVAAGLDEGGCRQRLSEFFARYGIGAERLEFKGRVLLPQYLRLHHEADLLLDSHPFSGHTVSCHALWMGVPVVTLAGDRHCSRMVASVLTNVGLPELIARDAEEYVRIAVELSADLPRLAALRASLRERMAASPLMDGPRFARNVEDAYRQMWRTWCSKKPALPPT